MSKSVSRWQHLESVSKKLISTGCFTDSSDDILPGSRHFPDNAAFPEEDAADMVFLISSDSLFQYENHNKPPLAILFKKESPENVLPGALKYKPRADLFDVHPGELTALVKQPDGRF